MVTIFVDGEPMKKRFARPNALVDFLVPYSPFKYGATAIGISNMMFSAEDKLAPIVKPKPKEVMT